VCKETELLRLPLEINTKLQHHESAANVKPVAAKTRWVGVAESGVTAVGSLCTSVGLWRGHTGLQSVCVIPVSG
jgi:hypothetical protein